MLSYLKSLCMFMIMAVIIAFPIDLILSNVILHNGHMIPLYYFLPLTILITMGIWWAATSEHQQ
jgi:hypothetical protein